MAFNRDDKRSGGGSGRGFGGGGRSFGGGSRFGGGGRGGSARPTMHSTTCSDWGNTCEGPFKPTGARPVFCSNCFKKEENGGDSRSSFDSRPARFNSDRSERPSFGGDRQLHDAICAKCGENCQVPFKPNDSKPVYCSNCFDKGAKGGQSSEQLDTINAKLDLIIKAMGLGSVSTKEKVEKKSEPEAKKEVAAPKKEKTKAKAKVASKKVSAKKKK